MKLEKSRKKSLKEVCKLFSSKLEMKKLMDKTAEMIMKNNSLVNALDISQSIMTMKTYARKLWTHVVPRKACKFSRQKKNIKT